MDISTHISKKEIKYSIGVGCHINRKKNNFGWTTRGGIFGRENTLRGFFGRENTQEFFLGRGIHTQENNFFRGGHAWGFLEEEERRKFFGREGFLFREC